MSARGAEWPLVAGAAPGRKQLSGMARQDWAADIRGDAAMLGECNLIATFQLTGGPRSETATTVDVYWYSGVRPAAATR
jgi:hypothetical protein